MPDDILTVTDGVKWKVEADNLNIRTGPSTNYESVGLLKKGDIVVVTESAGTNGVWKKHEKGWSSSQNGYMTLLDPTYVNLDTGEIQNSNTEDSNTTQGYQPDLAEYYVYDQQFDSDNNYTIRNVMGFMGLPYQFLPSVDTRLVDDGAALGRKYAEKIISRAPLLLITPGKPNFMAQYSTAQKKGVLELLIAAANGGVTEQITNSLENTKLFPKSVGSLSYL